MVADTNIEHNGALHGGDPSPVEGVKTNFTEVISLQVIKGYGPQYTSFS